MRRRVLLASVLVATVAALTGCWLLDTTPTTTIPTFIPSTPIPLSPLDGSSVPGTAVQFTWTECLGTEDYIIAICRGTEWTNENIFFNERIGDSTTVTIGNFNNDGQLYSWKLWAENSLGFSDPTIPWTFINSEGGGGVVGTAPTRIVVEYQIETVITRADQGDQLTTHTASIGSVGTITYNSALHIYSCDGQLAGLAVVAVEMEIHLNAAEDQIDYIYVERTMDRLGAWRKFDQLESFSVSSATIPFDRTEGGNKFYRLDSDTLVNFCDSIEVVDYRDWRIDPTFSESFESPFYRIKDPYSAFYHSCEAAGNFVEVAFEYD